MTKIDNNDEMGAVQLLMEVARRKRLSSELLRSRSNPSGFASQASLDECIHGLIGLGLVCEECETGSSSRRWLVATLIGVRVAEKLRKTQR
jgi:hypothetical protein